MNTTDYSKLLRLITRTGSSTGLASCSLQPHHLDNSKAEEHHRRHSIMLVKVRPHSHYILTLEVHLISLMLKALHQQPLP